MYLSFFNKNSFKKSLPHKGLLQKQSGIALVMAVYVLIVVTGGVLMMSNFMNVQNAASILYMEGLRARLAAYSGLEWMQFQLHAGSDCSGAPFVMVLEEADLADFSVHVDCRARTYSEQNSQVTIYDMTATATKGRLDASDYISRRLSMTLEFGGVALH